MMPKRSKGRQKIQMTKMEKESNLLVTFSKRRSGVFKKASELSILCGVEIAIIVFSPGKKVFSFGHPSVETIVDRFLAQNPPPNSTATQFMEVHRNANIHELNMQLACVTSHLEAAKSRNKQLSDIRKLGEDNHWWEGPIESLGLEELARLKIGMSVLKNNIDDHKKMHLVEAANHVPLFPICGLVGVDSGSMEVKELGHVVSMTPHGFVLGYETITR
ncbi:hypothetical protein QVD17_23400 [Tagetes erecta]|uniref:MADS-box domain-containing protein n=1 Tax=Tagetes erecta TaxID=13708 RepID=A0AAD8KGL2_TARER|nr:hypothetical protein QVD17_23400 [Tagetes erecta]